MQNKKLYLLPGLAFDYRIFQHLDLEGYDVKFINWIDPLKNESIRDYSSRLAEKIDVSQPVVLIGHSFGGVISQEIARLLEIEKIILISSIKSKQENAMNLKAVAPLGLHKMIGKELILKTFPLWSKAHGYEVEEEQMLFKDMIARQSDYYFEWSLRQLSLWEGVDGLKTPIVQIHGDKDKTFPIHLIENPTAVVKNAGHFMVYKQPEIISGLIKDHLN